MKRFRLVEAVSILLAAGAGPAASSCPEPSVTGLYEGTVKTGDGTTFEVTLNVLCADGKLGGQLFTSVGDFPTTSVTAEAGRVTIAFSVFGAASTLELTPKTGAVEGAFTIAGDKGTAAFARRGDALAPGAWEPRLDLTPQEWRADLATYARELPEHHANAFFHVAARAIRCGGRGSVEARRDGQWRRDVRGPSGDHKIDRRRAHRSRRAEGSPFHAAGDRQVRRRIPRRRDRTPKPPRRWARR